MSSTCRSAKVLSESSALAFGRATAT